MVLFRASAWIFNRPTVVRYRSFLEGLALSAAAINFHLTAILRLVDESGESGWLSPELATGIRKAALKRPTSPAPNWSVPIPRSPQVSGAEFESKY
jgi:hypothetical protein